MSPPVQLYRFRIQLSDIDRNVYEELDFRLAQHPSETPAFLLTRMLAYVLNYQPGLAFSAGGLSDPDEPCLSMPSAQGGLALWIEVGAPSARRLHKASKAAQKVKVYNHRFPEGWLRELASEEIHRAEALELYAVDPTFVAELEELLAKDNPWSLVHNEGSLSVSVENTSVAGELRPLRLENR